MISALCMKPGYTAGVLHDLHVDLAYIMMYVHMRDAWSLHSLGQWL